MFEKTMTYLKRRIREKQLIEIELRKRAHAGNIDSMSDVKYIGNNVYESGYGWYAPLASRFYMAHFKVNSDDTVVEIGRKLECMG